MFYSTTIKELLTKSKIDILDAELLLGFVIGKPKEYIIAHPEEKISNFKFQISKFLRLSKKCQNGTPLAYLIGHKEFYGLDFEVNKHTLVPRPETELLVESATKAINKKQIANSKILLIVDVGTGSGCIPISIMKAKKHKNIKTIATDISKRALKVAKRNAKKHNTEIKFLHGNLLEPASKLLPLVGGGRKGVSTNVIITANLPYLTEEQFQTELSIQHEPKSALVAKDKGLALYEELLKQIQNILKSCTLSLAAFFEIDPSQTNLIRPLIKKYLPQANIIIQKDLAMRDRVVTILID